MAKSCCRKFGITFDRFSALELSTPAAEFSGAVIQINMPNATAFATRK